MGAQLLSTQATVVHRTTGGDNWVRLQCFSPDHGRLDCLVRITKRSTAVTPVLDLFDEAQMTLESRNERRTWFIKEARVIHRRSGLGRSYEALRHACRFAAIIQKNPGPEESRLPVYDLLQRALEAWETGVRPDIVYFKSLYQLARDEGYPVAQEWRSRLPQDTRVLVALILSEPVAGQSTNAAGLADMTQNLEDYLRHHTEIRVGA